MDLALTDLKVEFASLGIVTGSQVYARPFGHSERKLCRNKAMFRWPMTC